MRCIKCKKGNMKSYSAYTWVHKGKRLWVDADKHDYLMCSECRHELFSIDLIKQIEAKANESEAKSE